MKWKLQSKPGMEDFFKDTRLLGIGSSLRVFQLCWHVNRLLGMEFRHYLELECLIGKKAKSGYFPVYEYAEPSCYTAHYLYSNHYRAEYLLPELKHLDFFWLMQGSYYSEQDVEVLMESLRRIKEVQLVTSVNLSEIRNLEHLML